MCWSFDKMSKRKVFSYFCNKRSKETEENKHLDELRVKKEGKHLMKAPVFKWNYWKNTHWLRYENQAGFCHFCHLGKRKNPFEVIWAIWILKRRYILLLMIRNCPPVVFVCPLPKAWKRQIVSKVPGAGSNPVEV